MVKIIFLFGKEETCMSTANTGLCNIFPEKGGFQVFSLNKL